MAGGDDSTGADGPTGSDRLPDGTSETGSRASTPDQAAGPDAADPTVAEPNDVWCRGDGSETVVDEGMLPVAVLDLHRYCDVWPFDGHSTPERADGDGGGSGDDQVRIRFLSGVMRTGLRITPTIVLGTSLLVIVTAELYPGVGGISALLPPLPTSVLLGIAGAGLLWLAMLWLVVGAGLVEYDELARAVVVYGTIGLLAVGSAVSVYLVLTAADPRELPRNVVFVSGYLLMLLLGGLLVYDGMLRTENLFENLPDTLVVEDGPDAIAYRQFAEQLAEELGGRTEIPVVGDVPTAHLFSLLFVSQFAAVWLFQSGPQSLGFPVTFVANVLFDLFIVAVAFQFLVLIKHFHDLVTGSLDIEVDPDGRGDAPGDRRATGDASGNGDDGSQPVVVRDVLTYRPFHPDGRGGFRDFGMFATRVNLLLILGGLYAVYRLYVQGARTLPTGGVPTTLDPSVAALLWAISYVGPVVAFAAAAGAWLYYSFWQLHLKMARERERQYIELQKERRKEGKRMDEPIGSIEDAPDWQEFRNAAPVWPIRTRQLASLVSGSVAPLVLSLPEFLL